MGNCDKVTYGYDALGRLVGSESTDGYDTSYDYDLNSSPTAIVRNGLTSDGFSIGVVDDLELRYDGNRLKKVIDLADAVNIESSLDFVESSDETSDLYDESGHMTAWPGLEGSSIKYAPNDMPVMIYTKDGSVEYRYRADGTKLATFVTTSEPSAGLGSLKELVTRKHYDIGSFRFCSSRRNPQMVLERVNLPWGYFDSEGIAHIYINDHQGNIRAVYSQSGSDIVQQTDYYPYGLPKATSTGAEVNPFKYGGKELNTHLPQPFYDFVARMQLPQLCLFQRPDPKASDYTWLNPFSYCAGDPINYIDMDGRLIIFVNGMHFGDGGSSEYWDGIDDLIMNDLNDHNAIYYDGSNGGKAGFPQNLDSKNREVDGYVDGLFDTGNILKSLGEGETIKFVTHSMGAAYTKGFISGMKKYGLKNNINVTEKIEFELDLAAYQPDLQTAHEDVPTAVVQHYSDGIAIPIKMPGTEKNYVTNKTIFNVPHRLITEHRIGSFINDIKDIIQNWFKDKDEEKK